MLRMDSDILQMTGPIRLDFQLICYFISIFALGSRISSPNQLNFYKTLKKKKEQFFQTKTNPNRAENLQIPTLATYWIDKL